MKLTARQPTIQEKREIALNKAKESPHSDTRRFYMIEYVRLHGIPKKSARQLVEEFTFGYVYLFKCNEFYKIGMTSDVWKRYQAVQNGIPYEVDIVEFFGCSNPNREEKSLHKRFKAKRHRGEWFKLEEDDIVIFKEKKRKWIEKAKNNDN